MLLLDKFVGVLGESVELFRLDGKCLGVLLGEAVELFRSDNEVFSGEAGQLFGVLPFLRELREGVLLADRVPHFVRL